MEIGGKLKPSRKERKKLADKKRAKYLMLITEEAEQLIQPKPLDKMWVIKLSSYIGRLKKENHLDAHLIQQSANQWQRFFLQAMKE